MNNGFYIGVVEDRHDPKLMGRVRVRVFGLHSSDRVNEVPIDSLPWSMVMHPANASSTAGAISQLVEGTWVLIMYLDENMQDPIVIGSLPSTLGSQTPDYSQGFSDPFGVYPKWSDGTADTTLAGKPDTYVQHPAYTERARTKIPKIPIAKKYKVSSVQADGPEEEYERVEWAEFELRNEQESQYPYNNVHEYEGGMIEEFDSTPGNQRITRTHPSGTYDEMLVDGTRTIKIVGDGYEIILGNKSMYVNGDLNITVDGNLNQLVKGNYTLEVGGDMNEMIGGSRQSKIVGNDVKEVGQDVSQNIGAEYYVRCGNTRSLTVGGDEFILISGSSNRQHGDDVSTAIIGNESRFTKGNYSKICLSDSMEITSGTHNIETIGDITIDSDKNIKVESKLILTGIGSSIFLNPGAGYYPNLGNFQELYGIEDVEVYKEMADAVQNMSIEEFENTYADTIDNVQEFWDNHQI